MYCPVLESCLTLGKFGKFQFTSEQTHLNITSRRFRVGAAVGSGMAAQAAESAGADFILALGAGRMRSMGVPSPASLLPIYDAVEFTLDFASSELLPRVQLPVYVGIPLFDPRLHIEDLLSRLKSLGISGMTNFPAVFHFGARAKKLDALGLGFDREISFLSAAAAAGLDTIGYVRNRDEASKMAAAGLTSLCINFSLNPPKREASIDDKILDRIALAAKDIVDPVRKTNRSMTIFLGGGPVSGGADLAELCRKAGIDGFIGGSAMDRSPLEKSLMNSVASFREIEVLQDRVERLERKLHRHSKRSGFVCRSYAMDQMLDRVEMSVKSAFHLSIWGELSTGRRAVAQLAVKQLQRGKNGSTYKLDFSALNNSAERLFGRVQNASHKKRVGILGCAAETELLILSGIEHLSDDDQSRVKQFLANGEYYANGGATVRLCPARAVLILPVFGSGETKLIDGLAELTHKDAILIPPLRDRTEDIPLLAKGFALEFDERASELPVSIVRTLIRHSWPGNLAELREAVRWLIEDKKMRLSISDLITYLSEENSLTGPATISQRDRIVQALLLNNLNRTKTAEHLGVTRKTLYNQIKKYKILQ